MTFSLSRLAMALVMINAYGHVAAACIEMTTSGESLAAVVKHAVAGSAAVFTGTVTAIEYIPATAGTERQREIQVIRMNTSAWWKGATQRDVTLYTKNYREADGTMTRESHEYRYEAGKTYLVFAQTSGKNLYADRCTRTSAIEDASGDITMLDALKAGQGG